MTAALRWRAYLIVSMLWRACVTTDRETVRGDWARRRVYGSGLCQCEASPSFNHRRACMGIPREVSASGMWCVGTRRCRQECLYCIARRCSRATPDAPAPARAQNAKRRAPGAGPTRDNRLRPRPALQDRCNSRTTHQTPRSDCRDTTAVSLTANAKRLGVRGASSSPSAAMFSPPTPPTRSARPAASSEARYGYPVRSTTQQTPAPRYARCHRRPDA